MNVISSEYLKEESCSSASYTIVIDDFKEKLARTKRGKVSTTEEFHLNWSKFNIALYIAGNKKKNEGYLSLFLHNRSDWMVRARKEISVKVMGDWGGLFSMNKLFLL